VKKKSNPPLAGIPLVDVIVAAAQDTLAEDIIVIDLHETETVADFFIICGSETDVQNRAIADAIIDKCVASDTRPWHYEGESEGRWVLLDFSDVVVHIMLTDLRTYYNLETMWATGKRLDY
jgi:ribosome-associated protein